MIQELFGGGAATLLGGGERKMSSFNGMLENSSNNTNSTTTTTTAAAADQQNLRCPRCDSSNTKFCYYNNYNLTQPRHFCKTCRRYWTKGGALRNVPIGGGCRKNKTISPAPATAVKSTAPKIKTLSAEFGKANFGFDLDPPSNPILWASPQNSQLMALLRAAQNQNPNPNPNSVGIKEEGGAMIGSYNNMSSDSVLNARPNGVDSLSQVPAALCNSFWRNNQHQQQQNLFMGGGDVQTQSTGIQELLLRLRSSGNYYSDHSSQMSNNVMPTLSSSSSMIMEPSAITGAEVGYWNTPSFAWSNLQATNGAYP